MSYWLERAERLAADALSGRIGAAQFGVFRFERLQLPKQPVVFGIGNFRVVQNVIPVIVPADLLAQRGDPVNGGDGGSHEARLARKKAALVTAVAVPVRQPCCASSSSPDWSF